MSDSVEREAAIIRDYNPKPMGEAVSMNMARAILDALSPMQPSEAPSPDGDAEKLAARLDEYRGSNAWGPNVRHTICDEAATMLRAQAAELARDSDELIASIQSHQETADRLDVAEATLARVQGERDAMREALEQIELLSTNHGGWFETDPWKWGQMMGTTARAALTKGEAK